MSLVAFVNAQKELTWQERAVRASVIAVTGAALACAGAAAVAAMLQGLMLGVLSIGAFQLTQHRRCLALALTRGLHRHFAPILTAAATEGTVAVAGGTGAPFLADAATTKSTSSGGQTAKAASTPSSLPPGWGRRLPSADDMKAFGDAMSAVRFRTTETTPKAEASPQEPGRVARALSDGATLALLTGGAALAAEEDSHWKPPDPGGAPMRPPGELAGPRATELRRSIQRLLNRVCPENVGTIVEKLADIELADSQELAFLIRTLFKRALLDPHYCETYADLAVGLYSVSQVPEGNSSVPFSGLLVDVCHVEFEALRATFKETLEESGCESEELDCELKKTKDKMLALMNLIGNLFLRGLMSSASIGAVLTDLIMEKEGSPIPEDYEVECACEVLKAVGATLQADPVSEHIVALAFQRLAELRKAKTARGKDVYCKRLQFAVQDLVDLRNASWVKKVFKSAAKTKDEIRCDAANEEELKHQGEDGVQRIIAGLRPQTIAGTKVTWGQSGPAIPTLPGSCGTPPSGQSTPKEPAKQQAEQRAEKRVIMMLPVGWAGKIIGPRGETARVLQDETGARIWVDRGASQARVSGTCEAVAAAELAIKALLPPPGSPEWRRTADDEVSESGSRSSGESETMQVERPHGRDGHKSDEQKSKVARWRKGRNASRG